VRRVVIIPAAGAGARLGTAGPKFLAPVAGRPMLQHVLDRFRPFVERAVVVVKAAHEAEGRARCSSGVLPVDWVHQEQPTGMLDAILVGVAALEARRPAQVWITWCDQVGVSHVTLTRLAARLDQGADVALPTVVVTHPYTLLVRGPGGEVQDIRHRREGDALPDRGESEMGVFGLSARAAFEWLPEFARQARAAEGTGERNFLPFLPWTTRRASLDTFACDDPMEARGINTPEDLAAVERFLLTRPVDAS
jgi:bifunctional UDP-N-acetylglucosamine pyrophosphorylase/glucosamine-1-phosphate N-acetyltransferase